MPSIFISYRRSDSGDITGRIYDRLVGHFGPDVIFRDIQSIPFGVDFRNYIETELSGCQVLVAVIGPTWLTVQDAEGNRRLDHPGDWVRLEIETALQRGIPVIPLLVSMARLPRAVDLPDCLQPLAYRSSTTARADPDFHPDMDRLIEGLTELLSTRSPAQVVSSPVPNNIPPPKTSCFVDRERPIETVHQLLQQHQLAVITSVNSAGGMGKTELATQYSLKHRQDYRGGVCWLYPKQSNLGPQITEFVRAHFSEILMIPGDLALQTQVSFCWNKWPEDDVLIVIDDLVDYSTVRSYLPINNPRFKVLITTRERLSLPRSQQLILGGLPRESSRQLLGHLWGEDVLQQQATLADQLCEYAEHLPQKLHLIAALAGDKFLTGEGG
ncbi:MAG: toll/interleukin-1 receptor domain-containing protein [Cyanobacteria bacterium P01_G01_bin.38]